MSERIEPVGYYVTRPQWISGPAYQFFTVSLEAAGAEVAAWKKSHEDASFTPLYTAEQIVSMIEDVRENVETTEPWSAREKRCVGTALDTILAQLDTPQP